MSFIKEMNNIDVIDTGVKSILDHIKDYSVPHFICCGDLGTNENRQRQFKTNLLAKMKSYGIEFAILTKLCMFRWKLVTNETVTNAYQGKLKNEQDWKHYEQSIHDDLDTFFANLQDFKKIEIEYVASFFTPKLTEGELNLVEETNKHHLSTYREYDYFRQNPDVNVEEMKKSDSKSKYVHGICRRYTKSLALENL